MAVRIRLARFGTKHKPVYHIVVADSRSPRDGKNIEKLGIYNPLLSHDSSERFKVNSERVKYWLGVGAKPSTDRLEKLLSSAIKQA